MESLTVTALTPEGTAGILKQLKIQKKATKAEKAKLNSIFIITTKDNPAQITMTIKNPVYRMMMGQGIGLKEEIIKGMEGAIIDIDYTVSIV